MLIERITAGPWQTNSYVLAKGPGGPCVVVDPGFDVSPQLTEVLASRSLVPAAIVLTHGHIDHVASVPEVSEQFDLPTWIHSNDEVLLTSPAVGLRAESVPLLDQFFGDAEANFMPKQLHKYEDATVIESAGLTFEVCHSPGHTPGCSVLLVTEGEDQLMLSGDVLFHDGVGRTDLPRSNPADMARSLRRIFATYQDDLAVYPGHGPDTKIGRERNESIFVRQAMSEG